ncbi:hypothetical protein GW17_00058044 [Ensete ventricosum]|nr:hypothetical protein GW17_00058044 [Ensete ventricosum]
MTGAMELQPDDGPRSSLSIGSGFGRCSGISPKFARRFAEGIRKLAGNMSGDRRKKTRRLTARMSKAARLTGVELNWLTRGLVNISSTAQTQGSGYFGRLTCPGPMGKSPVPRCSGG